MPAATAGVKSLLMRRLDLLDKHLPQLIQVWSVAAEQNAFRVTEETINHLDEGAGLNIRVGVSVGQAKEVKRMDQIAQTGECLPGRKPPMNRKL
jgi:hypothetical protein